MTDRRLLEQLKSALSQLNAPIRIQETGADSVPGVVRQSGDRLCVSIRRPNVTLSCPAAQPGGEDLLRLAAALAGSMLESGGKAESGSDVYLRALLGEVSGQELEALTNEYQLPHDLERCVMLFQVMRTGGERAFELLRDLTPVQERDVLVDVDSHTAVLIKDMSDEETMDELMQFCEALQETLMSETACQMTAGIGRSCHTMEELRVSYAEAKRALEVGRLFQPEGHVYAYSRLLLERFLMELPPDVCARYAGRLFGSRNAKLFNEEMLYTIDMFFRKDLNLSDTARQLYIHRNTLVYRLDKVQRQTGLDLRSFKDAVTFKILMELNKCAQSDPVNDSPMDSTTKG